QGTVVRVVLRQGDGEADGAHARHAVLGVPGLEVRVPVEGPAAESRLVVDSALVDVDVRAQELASTFHQAWVVDQVGEERTDLVCLEDGTDLVGGRLDDHALVLAEFTVGAEALEFLAVGLDLFTADERLDLGVSALVVSAQLFVAEGTAVLVTPDGGVLAVEERG